MSKSRKHLFIKGRVQGVFFRATMQDVAHANSVTGWVKNNYDGSVETVLEGEIENIEKVARWCRTGPRGAYVSEVNVKTEDYTGSFSTFSISFDRW